MQDEKNDRRDVNGQPVEQPETTGPTVDQENTRDSKEAPEQNRLA